MPEKLIFTRTDRKNQRVSPEDLELLGSRTAILRQAPVPGYQTFVRNDSSKGLPTDLDREKQVVLPPGSATPGGAGRDIPKFESNTPDNGIPERPRTNAEPGEDRGSPINNNVSSFSRRTMTSAEMLALRYLEAQDLLVEGIEKEGRWTQRWKPGQRQRRQKGPARTKSKQYYRRNRSKILMKQRQRRSKGSWKNNPARKKSEKRRQQQNRKRIGSVEPCAACLALRFAGFAPARERGGEGGGRQREQKRPDKVEDRNRHRKDRASDNRDAREFYRQKCKRNPQCMKRREEYREDPDYYKRRSPKLGSVLTVPDIAFVIGPEMVLGYVDSVSPLTGMVNFRLTEPNVSPMGSLPVEVFLRAATLMSDEDVTAFFELVDVEIGLEAYEDLDEEGLRECAGLFDVDPDADEFKSQCLDLTGEGDVSSMSADQLDMVNDALVLGVLEGGGEPRTEENADDEDETIGDEWDPHLYYGEVEDQKTRESE